MLSLVWEEQQKAKEIYLNVRGEVADYICSVTFFSKYICFGFFKGSEENDIVATKHLI